MNQVANLPVYSSSLNHLPMRLLVEPVEMDVALARLMQPAPTHPANSLVQHSDPDASWMWIEGGADALEVTEHLLPDGLDFLAFHALLSAAH